MKKNKTTKRTSFLIVLLACLFALSAGIIAFAAINNWTGPGTKIPGNTIKIGEANEISIGQSYTFESNDYALWEIEAIGETVNKTTVTLSQSKGGFTAAWDLELKITAIKTRGLVDCEECEWCTEGTGGTSCLDPQPEILTGTDATTWAGVTGFNLKVTTPATDAKLVGTNTIAIAAGVSTVEFWFSITDTAFATLAEYEFTFALTASEH